MSTQQRSTTDHVWMNVFLSFQKDHKSLLDHHSHGRFTNDHRLKHILEDYIRWGYFFIRPSIFLPFSSARLGLCPWGSTLRKATQTSVFPATSQSSSGRTIRHSQVIFSAFLPDVQTTSPGSPCYEGVAARLRVPPGTLSFPCRDFSHTAIFISSVSAVHSWWACSHCSSWFLFLAVRRETWHGQWLL